jgi:AraC-like DNA-binding protein
MPIHWDKHRVELNRAGRVRCGPEWRLTPEFANRLSDFDLWFVWAGRGEMQTRNGPIALRPGVCIWMRPNSRYDAVQDPKNRICVNFAHFDLVGPRGNIPYDHPSLPPEVHELPDVQYTDAIMRRIAELSLVAQRPGAPHDAKSAAVSLLTGLLMDIDQVIARLIGSGSPGTLGHHRRLVLEIASKISDAPQHAPHVEELARRSGYTPDHFSRVFREVIGLSPKQFIVEARLNRARQLLLESTLSVSQIAEELGYEDIFSFSRQFKTHTGRTPSRYRFGGRA